MNMNKKIVYLMIIFTLFFGLKNNINAASAKTAWNSTNETIEYEFKASVHGIKRIWLECSVNGNNQAITLYNGDLSKEKIVGTKDTNGLPVGSYSCKAYIETKGDNKDRQSEADINFTKNKYTPKTNSTTDIATSVSCESINVKEDCTSDKACTWNKHSNKCETGYVLDKPCSQDSILHVLHLIGYLLYIAKILVPLIIIGFATFDLFKAVTDKDDQSLKKQTRIVLTRILSGLIVFFIPSIVYALFGISSQFNTFRESEYQTCVDCLLKPTNGNCKYDVSIKADDSN